MGYDYLVEIIESIGHIALFLVLCLGLIGLPIPNEVVAMTGGALSHAEILHPGLAAMMIWLGICSSMLFNFSIGRFTNSRINKWFRSKQTEKQSKFTKKATDIIDKYGPLAIPICQFFPFLRHATPYIMGVNKMKFSRFCLYALPTAFLWTTAYFSLGYYVGDQIPEIIKIINRYETIIFILLIIIITLITLIKYRKWTHHKKNNNQKTTAT